MMCVSPEGGRTGESYHHDMGLICSYVTGHNFQDSSTADTLWMRRTAVIYLEQGLPPPSPELHQGLI